VQKNNLGLTALIKKTLAIIGASTTSLLNTAHAKEPLNGSQHGSNKLNIEEFKRRALKSKLVLKLKKTNIDEGMMVMHTSHSSHSSHASHASGGSSSGHYSHASHASHASHYSSVPSYSPSVVPSTAPKLSPITVPNYNSPYSKRSTIVSSDTTNYSESGSLPYYVLGSRVLFKGCRGTDVKELQQLLIKIGYNITADGYFGDGTTSAVLDFQKTNYLADDGKVGPSTLSFIQIKAL
jgi:hypothetical protein